MNRKEIYSIGLMSGTSLDGVDLVYAKFSSKDESKFEIINSNTVDYSNEWRQKLRNAIHLSQSDLDILDDEYGNFLGKTIKRFMIEYKIENVDFIASHGHTIFHQPEKGITKQIGNGKSIANVTDSLVVCDFRTQDVQLEGQGAPLVPIGDRLLFSQYDACINLGGFANISFEQESNRIAYDICPVNVVLNYYSQQLGHPYDDKGLFASQGKINKVILDKLNSLSYYYKLAPKSLGIEWVHDKIFPILKSIKSPYDALRTFVEHVSIQTANSIGQFQLVLFTGGGVYNEFLMQDIQSRVNTRIDIPSSTLINYKEALIFALLGKLKLEEKHNCLSSVTGAKKDHSSGQIFHPN